MRSIKIEVTFRQKETFAAYNAATDYLKNHGYSYGSMQRGSPTAIKKGDYLIEKWRYLTPEERENIDGIISGEFRNGPVSVFIYGGNT